MRIDLRSAVFLLCVFALSCSDSDKKTGGQEPGTPELGGNDVNSTPAPAFVDAPSSLVRGLDAKMQKMREECRGKKLFFRPDIVKPCTDVPLASWKCSEAGWNARLLQLSANANETDSPSLEWVGCGESPRAASGEYDLVALLWDESRKSWIVRFAFKASASSNQGEILVQKVVKGTDTAVVLQGACKSDYDCWEVWSSAANAAVAKSECEGSGVSATGEKFVSAKTCKTSAHVAQCIIYFNAHESRRFYTTVKMPECSGQGRAKSETF